MQASAVEYDRITVRLPKHRLQQCLLLLLRPLSSNGPGLVNVLTGRCLTIARLFIEPLPRNVQCLSNHFTILSHPGSLILGLHLWPGTWVWWERVSTVQQSDHQEPQLGRRASSSRRSKIRTWERKKQAQATVVTTMMTGIVYTVRVEELQVGQSSELSCVVWYSPDGKDVSRGHCQNPLPGND
jgi:hypothetical protein